MEGSEWGSLSPSPKGTWLPKGVCAFFLNLTFSKISVFSQGTREPRIIRIASTHASLERPAGNFLGQVLFFFLSLHNFPLLKISQAFSAEGAFALMF